MGSQHAAQSDSTIGMGLLPVIHNLSAHHRQHRVSANSTYADISVEELPSGAEALPSPALKRMIKVATLSRSAEALLPPHECGGFHHESAGFPVLTQTRKPVPFTTMSFSAACIGGFRARRNRPTGCMRRGTCRQTFSGGNQRTGRSRFRYLALASAVGRGPAARPGSRPNPAKRAAPTGRLLPSDRRSAVHASS